MSSLFFQYDLPAKLVSFGVRKTVGVKTPEVPLHILQKAKKNHKTIRNNAFAVLFIAMRDQFRCTLKIEKIES